MAYSFSNNQFIFTLTLHEEPKDFYNQLISLPILSQNLKNLYCTDNKLTSLLMLPQNLEILYCSPILEL